MDFRQQIESRPYSDAPTLADEFLLPLLKQGSNIYMLSAFAPSYIFRLVSKLASSKEEISGFLSIVFFVPGDLDQRSTGVARFRNYLRKYAESEIEVANFVDDALAAISLGQEGAIGGLRISILHTNQKRALAKGCLGVVTSWDDDEDYATFLDSKGGDFNSPVTPLRSWIDQDYFEAQDMLTTVVQASDGTHPRGVLVSGQEATSWLGLVADWYQDNPPEVKSPSTASVSDDLFDEDVDIEDEDEFLEHLLSLEEFEDEDKFGWFEQEDDEYDDFADAWVGYFIVVDPSEAVDGHIPPLPVYLQSSVGPANATCICGRRFRRATGCPEVFW